jgi:glycosyltransferase involved in cell wall biosynthesis
VRILYISARYAPHVGGLESVVRELATRAAGDHDVLILTNRLPRDLPASEQINGMTVRRLFFMFPRWRYLRDNPLIFIAGMVLTPLTLVQLWRQIVGFKPDVVNLHYAGNPTFFVWLLHTFMRFKLVVSLHGSDVWHEAIRTAFDRWLFRAVLRRAAAVTACSQTLLSDALALAPEGRANASAIYNGVNVDRFAHALPYVHARRYVFAVGRLIPRKGFAILIAAFARIADDYPDLDLLIAGEGGQRADLEAQIARAGLVDRIHLLGSQPPDAVASLMRGAGVVVVPSWEEAFGIVVIEGMAAGRPLVVTRLDGMIEAAGDAVVEWVAPNDAPDLARGLRAVLDAPDAAANAAHNADLVTDWSAVSTRYLDVLTRAARGDA